MRLRAFYGRCTGFASGRGSRRLAGRAATPK